METKPDTRTEQQHDAKRPVSEQSKLLADFLDWLIDDPERVKPNMPSIMIADEFLKSRQ